MDQFLFFIDSYPLSLYQKLVDMFDLDRGIWCRRLGFTGLALINAYNLLTQALTTYIFSSILDLIFLAIVWALPKSLKEQSIYQPNKLRLATDLTLMRNIVLWFLLLHIAALICSISIIVLYHLAWFKFIHYIELRFILIIGQFSFVSALFIIVCEKPPPRTKKAKVWHDTRAFNGV